MMQSGTTSRLVAHCFDANDPLRLARFWADALHREIDDETRDEIGLVPTDDTRFRIRFLPVPEKKAGKNRIHLDLTTTSVDDQKDTVGRLVELGARHIDIGQRPDEGHVVLADPEGTSSASSSRTTPSSLTADASDRLRAMVRRRLGTSGAQRSDGRWSGIRTKRPRSAPRTAPVRSSPGVRRFPRSSRRTGFISPSRRPTTVISERR
jgi:Glyoxalase-like domain